MNETVFDLHRYRKYYHQLEPAIQDRKTQAYLMVILSLFTISFFGTLAIRPTVKTIASLQRQIDDRAQVNQKLDQKINALIKAQEEYQRIEPDLPIIYSMLPNQPDFPLLLRMLENLVVQNSATISSIQFNPIVLYEERPLDSALVATPSSNIQEIISNVIPKSSPSPVHQIDVESIPTTQMSFTLSFQGEYSNLVKLLDQLTKLDRVVTINSIELSLGQTSGAMSLLTLGIRSQAYYYPTIL